jgi:AcrR family transcriptional regulator
MGQPTSSLRQKLRNAATEALLNSAERLMLRKGYENATMQEMAAAAGCATGTFYLYFKNKHVLLEAIVARHARAMFHAARAEMEADDNPLDKLRRNIAAVVRYGHNHRPFFRLFFTAMPMRQRVMVQQLDLARRHHDEHMQLEMRQIKQAQKRGLIRRDLPAQTLQEFMAAVGFSVIEQFTFSRRKQSVEEQARILWGLIAGGIGAARSRHERAQR